MSDGLRHVIDIASRGTLREHYLMLFGEAGAVSLIAGFIGAWIGARLAARRERMADARLQSLTDARLLELGHAMEALGVEMERMSEGQRFVARILAERRDGVALPPARREPGSITPH